MNKLDRIQELSKYIKLTGERAKLDAKANGTYIVYKNDQGQIVKEHANNEIEVVQDQGG
ncbi:hypothetical protein MJ257_12170 [Paenibacillus timonensis]|uniref:Uncharacterized protein n=1 Tax=Paenibacillus timonensis TaxID=225915 RepID=A0ABW3SCK8_9BACL|nr:MULTISPECIES: hypothetical protein [Paenibacillus]MCH1640863.1 hypothetical protein [Paenibacillus timonensis]MDU2239248.1 hypothetical protein [Paenibacillus sp.]